MDLSSIETQLLKVPFESLKRTARDRKSIVEELNAISQKIANLGGSTDITREQACQQLQELSTRLEALQTELRGLQHEAAAAAEEADAQRCHARVEHLAAIAPADSAIAWNSSRLQRILIDYLLRQGHWETAEQLVASSGCEQLVDVSVFQGARRVVESLRQHDCTLALKWCSENATRLKKNKSKLHFRLHVQVFIELVKQDREVEALQYARRELSPWAVTDLTEFRRVIALLVFGAHTTCARYKPLLADSHWEGLVQLFLQDLYKINSMSSISVLEVHLQAGLMALKTPLSYEETCTKEDPLHSPSMKQLAATLPWAKHVKSKLACAMTKTSMNDGNPPMALPNGYVYSRDGLEAQAQANDGTVTCPVTHESFELDECVRAYIL